MTHEQHISFGPFRLDAVNECLWRDSQALSLRPKAFSVLRYLVARAGRLVTKDELLDAVWPETYVSDVVLKVCVREIREVLGDQAKSPQYLETVHRRGYRFIAEVRSFLSVANGRQPAATPDGSWTTDRNPATTFVGREMELAHLHKWLEKTLRGERQVVFVTGEPGIGKTTVVETFLEQASAARPLWIARGQCLEQFGAGEAYLPVLEALSRLCREPGSASLVALLKQYAPTWLVQLPSLVSATDRDTLQREIFGATPERMLREMAEAVEVLTAETPLVLVLEDLHWSDYSTLVLIALLARRPESARLLVIGTYRPTEVILNQHPLKTVKQELRVHGRCEELPLEFLGEAAISEYLVLRFPANQFPTELAAVIHQRTDGNPLFMVNVVNYLVAQRLLVEQEGRWRLAGRLDEITVGVPEGIQQMIEKQIDQLSPEERRLLEAASVAGVEFSASVVAAVLGEETNQIETWCEALARSNQFLQAIAVSESPDGVVTARYCFTHALYQSVWYHRVPQARRIRWHQQIGEHNERIFGPRTREIAAELAMHFEAGRDYRRAVRYLRQAADNAARRYANREAMDCLTRALELIPRLPHDERIREHMAILEQRGLVRRSMGDMQGAAEDFQALAACAHEQGEFEVEVSALLYFGNALLWFDRERSLAAGEQAVKLSRQLKNTLLQAHARSYWGHWYSLVREWRDEDARACAEAVQAARQAGDRTLLSLHVSRYAYFQYAQSSYRAACRTAEEGLRLALEVGDVFNYLVCQFSRARALLLLGQWGETLHALREGIQLAEKNGHPWEMIFRAGTVWLHVEACDFDGARRLGESLLNQTTDGYVRLFGLTQLGLAHLGLGEYEPAAHCFSEIDRLLDEPRLWMNWIWRMPLHYALSQYWLTQRERERARREAEQVRTLAAQPGERTWLALGHRMLAEIALVEGRQDEAEAQLSHALTAIAGVEAPLAEWQVFAISGQIHEQHGRKAEAAADYARSAAVLTRLADSLTSSTGLPVEAVTEAAQLRERFLAHPLVQSILHRSDFGSSLTSPS